MIPEIWVRNSFPVEAIQVTGENIRAVASWCEGSVGQTQSKTYPKAYIDLCTVQYNKVRQTKAYVGDWILKTDEGFKHYRDESFRTAYSKKVSKYEEVLVLVEGAMDGKTAIKDVFGVYLTAEEVAREITRLFEGER